MRLFLDLLECWNNHPWVPSHGLAHMQTTHQFQSVKGNYLLAWQVTDLNAAAVGVYLTRSWECDFHFFKIWFSIVLWQLHDLHVFHDVLNLCWFINCIFRCKCSIYPFMLTHLFSLLLKDFGLVSDSILLQKIIDCRGILVSLTSLVQ